MHQKNNITYFYDIYIFYLSKEMVHLITIFLEIGKRGYESLGRALKVYVRLSRK